MKIYYAETWAGFITGESVPEKVKSLRSSHGVIFHSCSFYRVVSLTGSWDCADLTKEKGVK